MIIAFVGMLFIADEQRAAFYFEKEERVRAVKQIEHLFTHGKSFVAYPLRVVLLNNRE